jgi:hypothetical protein
VETTIHLHREERIANARQSVYAFVWIQNYPDVPPFLDRPRFGASSHGGCPRSNPSVRAAFVALDPVQLLDRNAEASF